MSGPVRILDVWFDSAVTDILVGRRTGRAQDNVGRAIEALRDLQLRLWHRAERARERLRAVDRERREILGSRR